MIFLLWLRMTLVDIGIIGLLFIFSLLFFSLSGGGGCDCGGKKKARECSGGIKINTDNDAFDNNIRVAVTWRCGITGRHSVDRIDAPTISTSKHAGAAIPVLRPARVRVMPLGDGTFFWVLCAVFIIPVPDFSILGPQLFHTSYMPI